MGIGKTALVTGASGGIGLEIARVLAAEGYDLVLVARSVDKLNALAAELGGARVIAADLSDPGAPAKVVAEVPVVDVLVNNAGVGSFGPFAETDLDRSLSMVNLNIGALTHLARAYLPSMIERGEGRIMNVASTAAFQPGPLMAVYYATKAYVLSLTEALAEELRGTGVTVTALCPGPTESGFQAEAEMEMSRLVQGRKMPSSAEVAASGVKAMHKGRVIHIPGALNRVMAASVRFGPRALVRRVVKKMQEAR